MLNIQRTLNPSDARVHRAACHWINGEPPRGDGFLGSYIRVCTDSLAGLTAWALAHAGAGVVPSGTCRPLPRTAATTPVPASIAPAGLSRLSVPAGSASGMAGAAQTGASLAGHRSSRAGAVTEAELGALGAACQQLDVRPWPYKEHDYMTNVLLTVLDLQMRNVVVEKSIRYYQDHRRDELRTLPQLQHLLARFPDDREGNRQVARHLWGNDLWTRVSWLRGLEAFPDGNGLQTDDELTAWARAASYKWDFEGRVPDLGPAAYQWLLMRLGVDTVKPDIRLRRFAESVVGHRVSDAELIRAFTEAAHRAGKPARELDAAIWERGALRAEP